MKIAIFSDTFYPEISGISDSIIAIVKELAKRGHKINIYAPKYSKDNYRFLGLPAKELAIHPNVNIIRLKSLSFKDVTNQGRFVFPIGKAFFDVRKFKPDVIHVNLPYGCGFQGFLASKLFKIPIVATDHTFLAGFIEDYVTKSQFLINLILKSYYWFYNKCDFITSPAKFIFQQYPKIKTQYKVVPNPVSQDIHNFTYAERLKLKRKLNLTGFTILFVGSLNLGKDPGIIIKSMFLLKKKNPKVRLIIAGKGITEGELRKMTKELGLENNIRFFGFLRGKELNELYNASDAFILMSKMEVQPLVIIRAFASSLPVIASNVGGLPELVSPKRGIVIPRNPKIISEKIDFLSKNPLKARFMGKEGRKFIKSLFPEKLAGEWEKIYKKVVFDYKKYSRY